MRFQEFRTFLTEAAKVGREYQHLEDLVFVKGSEGANEAADILEKLGGDTGDVAIKWDGNPTIYWGREPDGQFVLVGKNGWMKGTKSTSADEIANFIKTSGQGEDWREKFGNDMGQVFSIMQAVTPEDFRGYVYGDLLYHPGKPFNETDGKIQFTPNLVTYTVDKDSDLGKRISQSEVGVVVHSKYDEFGSKKGTPVSDVKELNSNNVVVLGQTYVTHTPNVDTSEVNQIRSMTQKFGDQIDRFLAGTKGLSNPAGIIYTYVNQMSRSRQLDKLESNFFEWLKNSKVSGGQQQKLAAMNDELPQALPGIFALVKEIMNVKNDIIDQLDNADADVQQSTGDEKGGEGYVALGPKVKLVPRSRWQPN